MNVRTRKVQLCVCVHATYRCPWERHISGNDTQLESEILGDLGVTANGVVAGHVLSLCEIVPSDI